MDPSGPPAPAPFTAVKPLGLPVGSVRALLALAVVARLVLDLREHAVAAPWLLAAVLIHCVSYFSARASRGGPGPRGRAPLALPGGTVRLLLVGGIVAAAWFYLRQHNVPADRLPVVWVVGGFGVGVVARGLFGRMQLPQDAGTPGIYHVQALVTLAAAAGLVWLGVDRSSAPPDWAEPLLAAFTTYYAGVR